MDKIKQVIIIRKDLSMRRGKSEAMAAHASMKVFFDKMKQSTVSMFLTSFTNEMKEWMKKDFTKVVLSCDSEEELFELQKQAEEANIVNAIIQDNGLTEFKEICPDCNGRGYYKESFQLTCPTCLQEGKINKPTFTCLAIGPDYSSKIDPITKNLKLR